MHLKGPKDALHRHIVSEWLCRASFGFLTCILEPLYPPGRRPPLLPSNMRMYM